MRRATGKTRRTTTLQKIITGGQTGADRGGLDAAIALGLEIGGFCPKGRKAEDGVIPARYSLRETPSADYRVRTRRNVIQSDGTLIIAPGTLAGGTLLTADVARKAKKPLLVLDLDHVTRNANVAADELRAWLERNEIDTLNVAGPRESQCVGIEVAVRRFLTRALG